MADDFVRAYHFVGHALRDGRPVPPDGEWLVHDGPLTLCRSGLHASRHPFDALTYAPGATLCLVDCDGVQDCDDKLVCRRRRIVARIDATDLLRTFARVCASDVLHLWDAPQVVRQYLATGDESLWAAVRDAARDAAWVWDAAWDAARDAAWDAAWDAARDAAWAAAWDAAWAAAWAAARDAARAAAWAAARDAAWDAAWAAARDAARDAQRERCTQMVDAAFAARGEGHRG